MNLPGDLRENYGDAIVSLQDLVRMLPDDSPFTEEQLRMLRTRHAKTGFPASYPTETRAVGHRLGELLDWLDDWARGESRPHRITFDANVSGDERVAINSDHLVAKEFDINESDGERTDIALDTIRVHGWRLAQAMRSTAAATSHIDAARELLVGVAIARALSSDSALLEAAQLNFDSLVDSMKLEAPLSSGLTSADSFAAALLTASSAAFTDEAAQRVVAEVDNAWRVLGHDELNFAKAIDRALSLTSVDVASRQLRIDPSLVEVMLAAVDTQPGETVADLTCGECDLLIALADQAAATGGRPVWLVGRDRDPHAWRIGKARLILHNLDHDLGPAPEEASRQRLRGVNADRVILDPAGAGHITAEDIANLIDAADEILTPKGRAVLALTASLLWPLHKRDRRLRGLENRVFALGRQPTAVIVPAGSGATTHHPGDAVWVHDAHRTFGDHHDPALTIIAMPPPPLGRSNGDARYALHAELRQILAADPVTGERHISEHGIRHRTVRYADIASRDYDYRPSTWLAITDTSDGSEQTRRYAEDLARELSRLIEPASTTKKKRRRGAPETASDGVLAGITTPDTRRAIRRLLATLAPTQTRGD